MKEGEQVRYLSTAELLAIHEHLMARAGTAATVLEAGKLESAALRPQMLMYYEGGDLIDQAVALTVGVALAHAFSDGNKRLALTAGLVFLDRNGVVVTADDTALAEALLAVVNHGDLPLPAATAALAAFLREHSRT